LFTYQTYTRPSVFYKLDLDSFNLEKVYDNHFLAQNSNYDAEDFTSDYVHFESKDGTSVPMTIIRRKDVLASVSEAPEKPILTHLTAYGGFGTSKKPEFSVQNLAFF
jgi:prolyl oligopeptidase PreP (S9A serine peptidase family)